MHIPLQATCDPEVPEEHALWALVHLPQVGAPLLMHPSVLREWSKHLWDCGFPHVDWLRSLADENGNIHVDQLPVQTKKLQRPFAGKQSVYNGATSWVDIDADEPPVRVLPDIRSLTVEENAAMLGQYRAAGMIPEPTEPGDSAFELK